MKLSEFLHHFDFDYCIDNGQIQLIDLQGAYLGDIDKDRFPLTSSGISKLVDRLGVYINEMTDDLEDQLENAGVDHKDANTLKELAQLADTHRVHYAKSAVSAVLQPGTIQLEPEYVARSFAKGQVFDELDTGRTIVLTHKNEPDIWNFQVLNAEGDYLYDTSETEIRLAIDMISGYVVVKNQEKEQEVKPPLESMIQSAQDRQLNANSSMVPHAIEPIRD